MARIFILRSLLLRSAGSYESGVAQIVDEDLVDEAVLSEGLDHHHPLSAELQQDVGDVQRLQQGIASESPPSGRRGRHTFGEQPTSLCSRQAMRISDRMTTPVRPTPALQWTSTGRLVFFGSLMLFVCLLTDWISSR